MNKQELIETENIAWIELAAIAPSETARNILMDGFREAYGLHVQWLEYYQSSYELGQKGFNEELNKLHKALVKLQQGKGTDEAAFKSINAAHKMIPKLYLEAFDTFLPDFELREPIGLFQRHIKALKESDADRQEILEKLIHVTNSFLSNLSSPGRGKRKRKAVQYVEPMERLKSYFEQAMPGYSLSAKRGTSLEKYIDTWLHLYAKTNSRDVERVLEQIRTT